MYRAERLDGVASIASPPRDIGIAVHDAIQRYLRALVEGESVEDAIYAALIAVGSSSYYGEVRDVFERWRARFDIPTENLFSIEERFERTLDGVPPIVGYVDIIHQPGENRLAIRDEKTGWATEIKPVHEFQLDLYAWMVEAQYPGYAIDREIEFSRTGIVKKLAPWSPQRREAFEVHLRAAWARLAESRQSGSWDVNPGSWCSYCPVLQSCATRQMAVGYGQAVGDEASAREAVRAAVLFDAASANRKTQLKAFVDANGPIDDNGVKAAFAPAESWGIKNVSGFLDVMGESGRTYLGLDGRKLKKLRDDARVSDLFVVTKRTNNFKVSVAKDESASEADTEESDDAE